MPEEIVPTNADDILLRGLLAQEDKVIGEIIEQASGISGDDLHDRLVTAFFEVTGRDLGAET